MARTSARDAQPKKTLDAESGSRLQFSSSTLIAAVSIRLEVVHQPRFRLEVRFHRVMVVEMIAREVREHGSVELSPSIRR